jgi:hypothetical protein
MDIRLILKNDTVVVVDIGRRDIELFLKYAREDNITFQVHRETGEVFTVNTREIKKIEFDLGPEYY